MLPSAAGKVERDCLGFPSPVMSKHEMKGWILYILLREGGGNCFEDRG